MKQIVDIRSNARYSQQENEKEFKLSPMMELTIIHTDGKNYKSSKNGLQAEHKFAETKIILTPEMLESLITDLQLHQKKFNTIRKNADQLNSLVKHLNSDSEIK